MRAQLSGRLIVVALLVVAALANARDVRAASEGEQANARAKLVRVIEKDARLTAEWTGKQAFDSGVMDALGRVPRHRFVPEQYEDEAYDNRPLPIGYGQTISQPYVVALMTDLLGVEAGDVVFELGTGSGYQAAVLAEIAAEVYSVEIVPALAESAAGRLDALGYDNVAVRAGDGYYGWEEHAPFDAIIVTAAANHVPPPLIKQLKPGGRMAIPIGSPFQTQLLMLIEKTQKGELISHQVLPVMFVPLTGKH